MTQSSICKLVMTGLSLFLLSIVPSFSNGQENGIFLDITLIDDNVGGFGIDMIGEGDEGTLSLNRWSDAFGFLFEQNRFSTLAIYQAAPEKALNVTQNGIGIGTFDTDSAIHVYSDDDLVDGYESANLMLENDQTQTALGTMFQLVNNGPSRFTFTNTNSVQTWAFQTNHSDNFLINRLGSGGNEFSIRKNGMVTMGPGGIKNFVLQPNGNLQISGAISQLSDRNAKMNFHEIDSSEVLDKVANLPITSWSYKDDDSGVRHMGPMAQDFRAAFGLGENDTSIAVVDAAGVTFAAIQALNLKIASKGARIQELERRLTESECQSDEYEQRFLKLESAVGELLQR